MPRNIKYQFLNAIDSTFKEGMDKHSIKGNGGTDGTKVYSYADREGLKDVSGNFSNWMKENHSDVKLVINIKSEHIQGFLNEKAKTCTYATLEQYAAKFKKLEKIVNKTYGRGKADYQGFVIPPGVENTKIRDIAMSKEDFKKLEEAFEKSNSYAKTAIQLGEKLGLRVSEVSKLQGRDIDLMKQEVRIINSKGKRNREVPIRPEDRAYFAALKAKTGDMERICPIQKESINKAINRKLKEMGIKEKYKHTSEHAIRKMYAQKEYDRLRAEGKSIQEAMNEVSKLLGHGENRNHLMRQYILNIK